MKPETLDGFAIEIKRDDGSSFLASSGNGNLPAVFVPSNRKWAVKLKKALRTHGLKAKVVPVTWTMPVIVKASQS